MHELGITQGIIDHAREAARDAGADAVDVLFLTITPAADFTRDSIEMYFEMLAGEDPLFAAARLAWEEAPVSALCLDCGAEFLTEASQPRCPQCASGIVRLDPQAAMIQLTGIGVDDGEED